MVGEGRFCIRFVGPRPRVFAQGVPYPYPPSVDEVIMVQAKWLDTDSTSKTFRIQAFVQPPDESHMWLVYDGTSQKMQKHTGYYQSYVTIPKDRATFTCTFWCDTKDGQRWRPSGPDHVIEFNKPGYVFLDPPVWELYAGRGARHTTAIRTGPELLHPRETSVDISFAPPAQIAAVDPLRGQLAALEKEVRLFHTDFAIMRRETAEAKARDETLRQQVAEVSKECKTLVNDNETTKRCLTRLQEAVDELGGRIRTMDERFDVRATKSCKDSCEDLMERMRSQLKDSCDSAAASTKVELDKLRREMSEFRSASSEELRLHRAGLESKISKAIEELELARTAAALTEGFKNSLREDLMKEVERSTVGGARELDSLRTKIIAEMQGLREEASKLRTDAADEFRRFRATAESLAKEFETLRGTEASLRDALRDQLSADFHRLQAEVNAHMCSLAKLEDVKTDVNANRDSLAELKARMDVFDEVKKVVNANTDSLVKLKDSLAEVKTEMSVLKSSSGSSIQQLKTDLEGQMKHRLCELEANIRAKYTDDLKNELAKLQRDLDKCNTACELEANTRAKYTEDLKNELAKLQRDLDAKVGLAEIKEIMSLLRTEIQSDLRQKSETSAAEQKRFEAALQVQVDAKVDKLLAEFQELQTKLQANANDVDELRGHLMDAMRTLQAKFERIPRRG